MKTQTEQIKDNGVFITPQNELTEEVNLRLFVKPKHDRIKEEILRGLKCNK